MSLLSYPASSLLHSPSPPPFPLPTFSPVTYLLNYLMYLLPKSAESRTLHLVIPLLTGQNTYSIVVDPCSHLVHLGAEGDGRQKIGEFDRYCIDKLVTVRLKSHEVFVFLASCGHGGGINSKDCNLPFDFRSDSSAVARISRSLGFGKRGIENCADLSLHIDVQDMLDPEDFTATLKSDGVRQRTLLPCDDEEIKAKAAQIELHSQLLHKDMAVNPTSLSQCSDYSGSCFKPNFIVDWQEEIDRLCALATRPSSLLARAVRPYMDAAHSTSDKFGKRHYEGLDPTPPRKSIRLSFK